MSSAQFGVVSSGPAAGSTEDNTIDFEALPAQFKEALNADDFVIYGKASIEQYDTDDIPTMIEMDALEDALGRFFSSKTAPGIISVGHQDIPIGVPLESYTLDEPRTIQVGDESYEFDAGDELTAHVEDADDDGRPELWLPSNIDGDTEMGKRMRLQALTGRLNGYSVTVRRNKAEGTDEGRRITECDLHAVTVGTDEQIKNKGSEFDVAEFKALFGPAPTGTDDTIVNTIVEGLRDGFDNMSIFDKVLGQELEQKGKELQGQADDDEEQTTDDTTEEKSESPETETESEDEPEEQKLDTEELAHAMAEAMGISPEEAMAMLQGEADVDDDEAEEDPEEGEMKSEEKSEETESGLSEDELDQKLEETGFVTKDELDTMLSEQAEEFKGAVGEIFDGVAEEVEGKMETGSTPEPTNGDTTEQLTNQINTARERQGSK